MIKAEELRIGNKFYPSASATDFIETVTSMGMDGINAIDGHMGAIYYEFDEKFIMPIPITEEILLKCGFKKRKYLEDYYIHINNCATILIWEKGVAYICAPNEKPAIYITCLYLHTLQNLYYWLASQNELTINL